VKAGKEDQMKVQIIDVETIYRRLLSSASAQEGSVARRKLIC
jgi:hypothetical protein